MIRTNDLIGERYKIINELGHGGMSDVYEARDNIFKRTVAIKIIKFDCAEKLENIIRFQNEARFSASFNHPNIVKIYDYGEINNLPYIVNEYVKGQTLRDILDYRRSFTVLEACQIMMQLCDAVTEIHKKNIIHRDIKPLNIYYLNDGSIKLGDFGISILVDSELNLNENKKVMGTVQYLAPEIVLGKKPCFQSDIYAMGITFFELLTGKVPFDSEVTSDVAAMQVNKEMISPLTINPKLPKEVEGIIMKATAKKPQDRYKFAEEMKQDIANILNDKNIKGLKKRHGFFGFGK